MIGRLNARTQVNNFPGSGAQRWLATFQHVLSGGARFSRGAAGFGDTGGDKAARKSGTYSGRGRFGDTELCFSKAADGRRA